MYRLLFNVVLRRIEPERAHEIGRRSLQIVRSTAAGRALVNRVAGRPDRSLEVRTLGRVFTSPVGVAAGLDKDATWFEHLGALGFGFVEVGTITAMPQDGNPCPRVARVLTERALVNRMGFPNPGAPACAERLARRTGDTIVGANVGKSMTVGLEDATADYRASVRALGPESDYLVVNVSSPNTPGLRSLQAGELLRPLIAGIRSELAEAGVTVPVLVKISPDLDDTALDALSRLALELELDGIVAVNTTVDRGLLTAPGNAGVPFDGGGVSGRPLAARALEVLRRLYANVGRRLVLVSVGGVQTPDDVWERILAGATLVQVYTGFVYEGPAWPSRVNQELARRLREAGASSIQELVGIDAGGQMADATDVAARA